MSVMKDGAMTLLVWCVLNWDYHQKVSHCMPVIKYAGCANQYATYICLKEPVVFIQVFILFLLRVPRHNFYFELELVLTVFNA